MREGSSVRYAPRLIDSRRGKYPRWPAIGRFFPPMTLSPFFRRVIAVTLACLYAVIISGIPLSIPGIALLNGSRRAATKDLSKPFPCMNHPCGCDSAEKCLKNCCCYSPGAMLAWAQSRGIDDSVIAALTLRARGMKAGAPRHHAPPPPAWQESEDDPDSAVCRDYQSLAADPGRHDEAREDSPADPRADEEPVAQVVSLRAMLACGGISSYWSGVATTPPPTQPLEPIDLITPIVEVLRLIDDVVSRWRAAPDTPPPRMA